MYIFNIIVQNINTLLSNSISQQQTFMYPLDLFALFLWIDGCTACAFSSFAMLAPYDDSILNNFFMLNWKNEYECK